MIRSSWGAVVAILIAIASIGCGKKAGGEGGKPKVAVSIFPLYDLTKRIAGDRLDVMLVLPAGKSEHGYDPTPQEIARLDGAKLAIAVGLDMDAWLESIMTSAKIGSVFHLGEKLPTNPISVEPIGEPEDHEGEHGEHDGDEHHHASGAPDPHVWMDPHLMQQGVDLIAEQLAAIDPAGKATFLANAATVKQSLAALDARLAERSKAWTKRTIVTFHGSMAYFAKRYNVRIAAVVEPLAGKEPTAAYIAEVLKAIQIGQAAGLFSEPQLDKGPGEMIAKEAGIKLGELDPVGGLAGRESYEALLTWNADQLEAILK